MEIKPLYEHSKIGSFMFNLCAKWTKFILKHRWLYYFMACTWGIIMTILGCLITLILAIVKIFIPDKITFKSFYWIYGIKVGPDVWGGCEMGLMFLRDQESTVEGIDWHEFGHTFQNCLFGPLFPFIVAIPSAIRYWLRIWFPNKEWAPYDGAWFEDAATQCGEYAVKFLNQKQEALDEKEKQY